MQLRVGSRWRSAVDDTQVVVVRAPQGDISLTCGGHPLIPSDSQPTPGLTISEGSTGGTAPRVTRTTNWTHDCNAGGNGIGWQRIWELRAFQPR